MSQKNKKSPIQTTIYNYIQATPKVTRIFDKKDKRNIGILYWSQETLEKLTELSGPLANSNEYQIHYWALVARQTFEDGSILDIAFPTAIFNYEQEVSGAHIDFELKDVKEVSDAIQPIHNIVTNQLLPQLQELFKAVAVEFLSVPMNTMHRHPTGVASFSGTDLKKDHLKDTGIVFPLQAANETPSFSSIIYNKPVKMVHSEYRIATGNTEEESGIKYREGRCATYVKGQVVPTSIAERFIGITAKDTTHLVTKDSELAKISLEDMLSTINYEPNTQFVKKENLKKKIYSYYDKTSTPTINTKNNKKSEDNKSTEQTLVYEKEKIVEIKKTLKLDIKNYIDLKQMTIYALKMHCLPLERYYYMDDNITLNEYLKFSGKDLIDHALELQDLVIEEFYVGSAIFEELEVTNDIDKETAEIINSMFDSDDETYLYTFGYDASEPSPTDNINKKISELAALGVEETALRAADLLTINRWYDEITK